jgi:hypothetical protein
MMFLGPLIYILGISSGLVVLTKRPFQRVLPLSLIGSVLVLYMFALFNVLWLGFWVLVLLAVAGVIGVIMYLRSQNSPTLGAWILANLVTPGLILFFLIYLFLFFLNLDRGYNFWDDFSHWGPMVKEMIRTGNLYDLPDSLATFHKDYPPAIQLVRYLFCMLGGGYSESLCFTATQVLVLSFFISIFSFGWSKRTWFYGSVFIVVSFLAPMLVATIYGASLITATNLDTPLALTAGYVLYLSLRSSSKRQGSNFSGGLLYKDNKKSKPTDLNSVTADSTLTWHHSLFSFHLVEFTLALIFLVLVKPTTLLFCGLAILSFSLTKLLSRNTEADHKRSSKIIKDDWVTLGYLSLITIASYSTWIIRAKVLGNESQGVLDLGSVWNILFGHPENYQSEAANNYLDALWSRTVITISPGIEVTLPTFIFALVVLMFVGRLLFWRLSQFITALSITVLGGVIYVFMMFVVYQTQFSEAEAIRVTDFERYMMTFPLAILVFWVCNLFRFLAASVSNGRKRKKDRALNLIPKFSAVGFSLLLALALPINFWAFFIPPTSNTSASEYYTPAAELIIGNTEIGSTVYAISELDDNTTVRLAYKIFQHNGFNFFEDSPQLWGKQPIDLVLSDKSIGNKQALTAGDNISPEQFVTAFQNANVDYIYLANFDEYFAQTYGTLFPDFAQGKLYKVTDAGFELVG